MSFHKHSLTKRFLSRPRTSVCDVHRWSLLLSKGVRPSCKPFYNLQKRYREAVAYQEVLRHLRRHQLALVNNGLGRKGARVELGVLGIAGNSHHLVNLHHKINPSVKDELSVLPGLKGTSYTCKLTNNQRTPTDST